MNWLKKFMAGRYGPDQLALAITILYLICAIFAVIFNSTILTILSFLILAYYLFRTLSKNISKRQKENYAFLKVWRPIQQWFKLQYRKIKDIGKYKYFKCKTCGKELRVPSGKGKISVKCPNCSAKSIIKS